MLGLYLFDLEVPLETKPQYQACSRLRHVTNYILLSTFFVDILTPESTVVQSIP